MSADIRWQITPMYRDYKGNELTAHPADADWFRAEVDGRFVGDHATLEDARLAVAVAVATPAQEGR